MCVGGFKEKIADTFTQGTLAKLTSFTSRRSLRLNQVTPYGISVGDKDMLKKS
jgi:hypothetical protein